jgi:ABC-type lipoprotein release transport system permease subunit
MGLRLVPWSYPWRNLLVRWQAALFSALGIAMTVAVLCGVFALRNGFEAFMATTGSPDVVVYLRPGATSEGESGIGLERVEQYKKERPEVALDEGGRPLAAGEIYLALFLDKADGSGQVNVPIRGVEEASFAIQGAAWRRVEGRMLRFGADEILVGRPLVDRIADCRLGDTLVVNLTPFKVVGIFEHDGAYRSEIWGDVDRIAAALERPVRQRVVARLRPGTDIDAVAAELAADRQLASKVMTEEAYFASQTNVLGGVLTILGLLLTTILGVAGVLGAANTMIAAVGARTREIGVLRSLGYGSVGILVAFLVEAGLIGAVGGLLGGLLVLPLDGLQTGTMNWNTFTETTFAFRVDAGLLGQAVGLAVGLGLVGGLVPAWRASRLRPVEALRRG